MNNRFLKTLAGCTFLRTIASLFIVYVLMMICRLVFMGENYALLTHTAESYWLTFAGGLKFDTAAIMYGNILWLAMVYFPLRAKERQGWWKAQKWVFTVCNSLLLLANLADTVFFAYRRQRSTAAIFSEFGGENNLLGIVGREMLSHWYLVLLFVAMVLTLWKCYVRPVSQRTLSLPPVRYYIGMVAGLGIWTFCFITGVRGSLPSPYNRPMSVNYAQRYAVSPNDAAAVLNTPFSVIRTLGHGITQAPRFYEDEAVVESLYSPIHQPADTALLPGRNVVVLLLESFGQEFSGALNPDLDGGNYRGYTPCLDSIMAHSFRMTDMIGNTGFSIDALPAVFASTPRVERSFVTTPYAQNHITALPALLDSIGYDSAFFHGADNESLGLQAFARHAGFKAYYGLTEYCADPTTGGMDDFDGSWGIWDEEFLQFFCRRLSDLKPPFVAGVFTLSSHHPFVVPDRYKERFPEEPGLGVYHTLRYADMALGEFFRSASKQPWFDNTIFIISADHAFLSPTEHDIYHNPLAEARIPILIYDPSGTIPAGVGDGIMQQIDVMPTLLSLLGYPKPYFAFGRDVFAKDGGEPWAFRWTTVPELVMDGHVIQLDTSNWGVRGFYDYRKDPRLANDLKADGSALQQHMDSMLRAVIQTYQTCENADSVNLSFKH